MKKFRMPTKRWKRAFLYLFSTAAVILAADMTLTRAWRHVTISRETTHITDPLLPGGMPDYNRWLNDRMSRGVTPENNAARPIILAAGTEGTLAEGHRDQVLAALGLPVEKLPRKHQFFSLWARDELKANTSSAQMPPNPPSASYEELEKQETELYTHPWKAQEHPLWAQWLDSQREALELAHEAASRPRFHVPALPARPANQPGETIMALLPSLGVIRSLSNLQLSDAQRHAGDGNAPLFLRDVIDSMKIGALLTQRPFVIEHFVGYAIQGNAHRAILTALADSGTLSASDARALLKELDAVPPLKELDYSGERAFSLDLCCFVSAFGYSRTLFGLSDFTTKMDAKDPPFAPLQALTVPIHLNPIMRNINRIFDQVEQGQQLPTYRQRAEVIERLEKELHASELSRIRWSTGVNRVLPSQEPWMTRACENRQTALVERDLVRLALALHAYRTEKGQYPATLDMLLSPGGPLASIPVDGFSNEPFHYKKVETGYLLHGVGPNGNDDGGDKEKDQIVRVTK